MTARRRIMAPTEKVAATRVLRRRTRPDTAESSEGDIIHMNEGEDFSLNLLKKSPATVSPFRYGEYLHVSDLLGKCMRKIALSDKFGIQMPSMFVHESMALTFAQGTAIHDHVKARVLKGHPDKLYGSWSCRCGQLHIENTTFSKAKDKTCRMCGQAPLQYHEMELRDDDLKLVGSPDLTILMDAPRVFYPIEIKSINHEEWKELARPKPDHVLQVLFYWYLLRKLGYPVPNQISIVYVTKGFVFKTPYKEFLVFPENAVGRLDEYIEEARALKTSRGGGGLPARSFCSNRECKDAKDCHVANLCFQHE